MFLRVFAFLWDCWQVLTVVGARRLRRIARRLLFGTAHCGIKMSVSDHCIMLQGDSRRISQPSSHGLYRELLDQFRFERCTQIVEYSRPGFQTGFVDDSMETCSQIAVEPSIYALCRFPIPCIYNVNVPLFSKL